MISRRFPTLMFSVVTFIGFGAANEKRALAATLDNGDECAEIEPLIRKLRSANERRRETANKAILRFSSKSASCRQCVIKRMLKIASRPTAEPHGWVKLFFQYPHRFYEWSEATDILGTMKAMEALDTLIACLGCNDGIIGLGVGRFPASRAVVKFGEEAIPKIAEALKQKPRETRYYAAVVLYTIGGDRARDALQKALAAETDRMLAGDMKNMLVRWHPLRTYGEPGG
jgi:HEAT repeat protein